MVAIDGKSLAGAFEVGAQATPLHLVTAWATDQRPVLAQRRAPGHSEVTAALEIVGLLNLHACAVTAVTPTGKPARARDEERRAAVAPVPQDWLERFKFNRLAAVARIAAIRRTAKKGEEAFRCYSVLSRVLAAEDALQVARSHWCIENQQHWLLDVESDEDRARTRKDHGAEDLAR